MRIDRKPCLQYTHGMKLLLGDALAQIDPAVLPAGSQATQIAWINQVLAHFYLAGKWAGTTVRWKGQNTGASFAIYYDSSNNAVVTLPRGMLSLLAAAYGQTNVPPTAQLRFSNSTIRGPWFEFINGGFGGYGVGDQTWGNGVQDIGDGWTTFQDLTEPSYLRVVTSEAEASGATMLFRGTDGNGNQIYSGSGAGTINGVTLNISTALQTQTTQIFGAAPTLIQKPITYGPVSLYSVGVASGTVTQIGLYDPGDTSPGFRRYRLGGATINPGQTVIPYTTLHAMVKRRNVPMVSLSDEVIPGNIPAIELGLQGRRYDLQSDTKTADEYWGEAIALLNAELSEYNGAAVPRINFQRGTNLAGIPYVH
jgi:hypothetical protein